MDKSWSFLSRKGNVGSGEGEKEEALQELPKVLEEVDGFIGRRSGSEDVPECVGVLAKLLEYMVDKYNNGVGRSKFGEEAEDDKSFLDALDRISKVSTIITFSSLDQTNSALEKAMVFLEKELCTLLEDPKSKVPNKSFSFSSFNSIDSDLSAIPENESPRPPGQDHDDPNHLPPNFSTHKLSILNKIVTAMITAGYRTECCMAFANFRRIAFKITLQSLGYGSVGVEDVYKMQWESLEGEIGTWNKLVRHCTTVLFNAERRLYESVFPNQPSISENLFSDLARAIIFHFLNFAQSTVLTKRSTEKMFKFLDMYETLKELEAGIIGDSYMEQCAKELLYETATTKDMIVEAIVAMFRDLENSIKSHNERIPVPNGAVHPLTRYVMNYLKYACEYKDTLEQIFEKCVHVKEIQKQKSIQNMVNDADVDDGTPKNSPFAVQLMTIMDLLDANVERKSKLYRDPALRYIFLMNNGRYIVQKIKGCTEIHRSMGDTWCRKRQSGLRLYHKSYQRETWYKVLQCLNPEGLQGGTGSKVSKQVLKERFKSFNATFEEIHKTQSAWMVSDEQLQSELRVSITALVIPAYRTFVGRFKHHLESSRNIDKYIKYHPEDIEILIDDLFDGHATSMARKRNS
ncbi:hypothetical protein VNO77_11785 [Canavalia gladiata]|uniref:Exocyst subunit Exo70 family protein n=1 Tax=Canavalia gladiata TaxID=3824 RepID=A0AAN9LW52_CANGL